MDESIDRAYGVKHKVIRKPEHQEILECPADGCGESRGRIERVEVYPGESVAILLRCNQGHWWWMSIDERGDELLYTVGAVRTWPPLEDEPHSVGRVVDDE
jgi:hypothetical protein